MAQLSGNRQGISEGGSHGCVQDKGKCFHLRLQSKLDRRLVFHFRKITQGIEKTC